MAIATSTLVAIGAAVSAAAAATSAGYTIAKGSPKMPTIKPMAPAKPPPTQTPPPPAVIEAPKQEMGAERAAAEELNKTKARRRRTSDIGVPSPSSLVSRSVLGN